MISNKEKKELEVLQIIDDMASPKGATIVIIDTINKIKYIDIANSHFQFKITENLENLETIKGKKYVRYDLLMPVIEKMYETVLILPHNGRDNNIIEVE